MASAEVYEAFRSESIELHVDRRPGRACQSGEILLGERQHDSARPVSVDVRKHQEASGKTRIHREVRRFGDLS
jgi:hypothetical protein